MCIRDRVWAVPRSLATTCGITFVFFSYGYLDVSVPHVRLPYEMCIRDRTGRIVASARIDKYLDNVIPNYSFNQEVDLLVAEDTEIGLSLIHI